MRGRVDFPTGLSNIKGDFVFDDTRLSFNDMTRGSRRRDAPRVRQLDL